jgi:glycosyltransferase involved in cell wall biosynthesis
MRICLVSEELAFGKGSGGIGGAFHELALLLARSGHAVDLLYVPASGAAPAPDLVGYFADRAIRVFGADLDRYAWDPLSYERRAYGVFRTLRDQETPYDCIHFHDYKGLGFFCLAAKQQRLAFADTVLAVQVHGPTRWALQANDHPFTHEDQLKIDFMERGSVARADVLIAPSRYMLDWLSENGWATPPAERVHVIQNPCGHLVSLLGGLARQPRAAAPRFQEIVFFGRHEERKGLVPFCDAIDLIRDELADAGVRITFLGGFGEVNGDASAIYLANRAARWQMPLRVLPDLDRISAVRLLAESREALVVIASPVENSPYTVLEAIVAGRPLLTSRAGGAGELLDAESARAMTCDLDHRTLAARIGAAVRGGLPAPRLAVSPAVTDAHWLDLHKALRTKFPAKPSARHAAAPPKVVAAITHHERPAKLYEAVLSLAAQTYPNIELVVVDDGSRSPETLEALARLEPLFAKLGVRMIRQENKYLGAARNRAVAETESDYVLFLDDDDIAFPTLVQTLVTAAQATQADIVNCLNLFMPEARRAEAYPFPDGFEQKASYVPLGGPLSLAPFDNCFGAATALIRRTSLARLRGYTEEYGVGHEDFELYIRAAEAGMRIEVCPLPLYLYEVDRPSMVQNTSRLRNWNRVVRALDVAAAPAAWRDLAALSAGRRAHEHIGNNALYRRRTSPHAAILTRIAGLGTAEADYAAAVADYAQRVGASNFARAMQRLAEIRRARSDAGPVETLLPALLLDDAAPSVVSQRHNALMFGALVDLSYGRIADAVAAFRLSRERGAGSLDPAELAFLRRLCRERAAGEQELRPVLDLLVRLKLPLDGFRDLAEPLFHLALRVGEATVAQRVAERAMAVDEELYCITAPDVPRGQSALEHHLAKGDAARGGRDFVLTRALRGTLAAELGVEPPLASFRQYLAGLARGLPARPAQRPAARNHAAPLAAPLAAAE